MNNSCIIYDCEILKCIPDKRVDLSEFYECCSGWDDFENMGISVIGYCDSINSPQICLWERWEDRIKLRQALDATDIIIGFNSRSFDDNLLAANNLACWTDYDLLEEIRLAAYGSDRWELQPEGYSYSLGKIASANGLAKTGSGAQAPQLWQQGKRQEVIDYCLNDVAITRSILQLGLKGDLVDPNTGELLQLRSLNAIKPHQSQETT